MYPILKTTRELLQTCQKTLERIEINRRSTTHLMDLKHVVEVQGSASWLFVFKGTESTCDGIKGVDNDVESRMEELLQSQHVYHAQEFRGHSLPVQPPTSPSNNLFEVVGPKCQWGRIKVEAARVSQCQRSRGLNTLSTVTWHDWSKWWSNLLPNPSEGVLACILKGCDCSDQWRSHDVTYQFG